MSRLDYCQNELIRHRCYDWKNNNCDGCNIFRAYCEGARRAKKSQAGAPSGDLISRADAIGAVRKLVPCEVEIDCTCLDKSEIMLELMLLPSAEAIPLSVADKIGEERERLEDRVAELTEALSAEAVQGWIPLSHDGMGTDFPYWRDGEWVIVTDGEKISVERIKKDAYDHFYPNGRWFELDEVVAWMPLPKPYKGGGDE